MRRRDFIAVASGAAAYPAASPAQQRLPVIAVLNAGSAASTQSYAKALIEGMSARGYVDGRNIRIEYRFADATLARDVRTERMLVGMSQEKIGQACGITLQQVSQVPSSSFYEGARADQGSAGSFVLDRGSRSVTDFLSTSEGLELVKPSWPKARRAVVVSSIW